MKKLFFIIVCFIFLQNILFASPIFPKLIGRVVDNANILSEKQEEELNLILQSEEQRTSNQIVVVTLDSLKGYDIADYSYQLGRYWAIGQKDKNNGILLIISMTEKKIRIEVGYGLEGVLTDNKAHEIIEYILKPNFRQNNFFNGIKKAINAIIEVIKGEYNSKDYRVLSSSSEKTFFIYLIVIFFSGIFGAILRKIANQTILKMFHSSMIAGFGGAFATGFFNSISISIFAYLIIAVIVFLKTKKISSKKYSITNPNYSNNINRISSNSFSKSSSSSFTGGGGSFGGGGASGGW